MMEEILWMIRHSFASQQFPATLCITTLKVKHILWVGTNLPLPLQPWLSTKWLSSFLTLEKVPHWPSFGSQDDLKELAQECLTSQLAPSIQRRRWTKHVSRCGKCLINGKDNVQTSNKGCTMWIKIIKLVSVVLLTIQTKWRSESLACTLSVF